MTTAHVVFPNALGILGFSSDLLNTTVLTNL